jgi:hypothetical protein
MRFVKREHEQAHRRPKPENVPNRCFTVVCQHGSVSIHAEKVVVLNICTAEGDSYKTRGWCWNQVTAAAGHVFFFFTINGRLKKN